MTVFHLNGLPRLTAALGFCTFAAGILSFSGWVFDIPRLTDWLSDGISIQPNTAILIAFAGLAVTLLQFGWFRATLLIGGVVALGGILSLLQYMTNTDLGFNHQLLFGRQWGYAATMSPGRFGPPASISFVIIGISLTYLGTR